MLWRLLPVLFCAVFAGCTSAAPPGPDPLPLDSHDVAEPSASAPKPVACEPGRIPTLVVLSDQAASQEQWCADPHTGRRDGPYRSDYFNGQVAEQGHYRDGQRVGIWKRWRWTGEPHMIGEYLDDQRHGSWSIKLDGSKAPIWSGSYEHGQLHGRWVLRSENSRVMRREAVFEHGEPRMWGIYEMGPPSRVEWSEQRVVITRDFADRRFEKVISSPEGIARAHALMAGPSLEKRESSHWSILPLFNLLYGESRTYKGDRLLSTEHFSDGHETHVLRHYHGNGSISLEEHYVNHRAHGPFRMWSGGGRLVLDAHNDEGRRHGRWTRWYFDGQKKETGIYDHGQRVGRWRYWDRQGRRTPPPPDRAEALLAMQVEHARRTQESLTAPDRTPRTPSRPARSPT